MDRSFSRAAVAALVSSFAFMLAACGGGSSSATVDGTAASQTVEGVSTPSSVSVVTATNAN